MKEKPKSDRMYSLVVLYDMHTNFFNKAIEGIAEKDAHNRLNTKANHAAWLAGSFIQERLQLANMLSGSELKQSADELFKNHQGIKDGAQYPSMTEYKKDADIAAPALRDVLMNLSDEKLDSIFEMPDMPDMKMPYFDLIAFMTYREANLIGQLILWRRLLGYEGIKYDD
jgi:hypothetical protein